MNNITRKHQQKLQLTRARLMRSSPPLPSAVCFAHTGSRPSHLGCRLSRQITTQPGFVYPITTLISMTSHTFIIPIIITQHRLNDTRVSFKQAFQLVCRYRELTQLTYNFYSLINLSTVFFPLFSFLLLSLQTVKCLISNK